MNDQVLCGLIFEYVYDILHYEHYYFMWKWKCHEHGTQKKSESLKGFEPMTSQTLGGRSIHLSYGELMETLIYKMKFEILC